MPFLTPEQADRVLTLKPSLGRWNTRCVVCLFCGESCKPRTARRLSMLRVGFIVQGFVCEFCSRRF